jgi:predicted GNAT family acetyltransferase
MSEESAEEATADVVVTNNEAAKRYEVHVAGELAGFTTYLTRDGRVAFTHAEVFPRWEGQGVGSALARGALDDTVAAGDLITPVCPFIVDYISRHPSYLPHVDEVHRQEIEAMIAVAPEDGEVA